MKKLLALLVFALALPAPALAIDVMGQSQNAVGVGAPATITMAGAPGNRWVVEGVAISCSATPAAPVLLTITDGSRLIFQHYGQYNEFLEFDDVKITMGNTLTVQWGSCGAGITGSVNLIYKNF